MNTRAGQPAQPSDLIDVHELIAAYFEKVPDVSIPAQRVVFGTSGHRGSSLDTAFNDTHIAAITQAIVEYRTAQGTTGPLFIGKDTHGLSRPAETTALEVLVANGVRVLVDEFDDWVPTPALSHAIIRTLIESEPPAPKPKRAPSAAVATAETPATPVAPTVRPRPTAPRAPRASTGSIPNSYPFDEVMGMSEDVLLAEFDALAIHPDTGVRGSAESPRFSAVAWRLVEAHGHRLSDLARRAGHADPGKLKDRVKNVRAKAPVAV